MTEDFLAHQQSYKWRQLQEAVGRAAQQSPLYREKYTGFDLEGDFNGVFQSLPLLSRDEYYEGMKPPHFSLLAGGPRSSYIFTSGGTTGDVKLTAWRHDFVRNWTDECFRSLTAVGLQAGDVVVNLFFPGIWATHTLINKSLEKAGCRIIPLGGKVSLELLVEYLERFRVTALIGVPSFIVRLVEYIGTLPGERRQGIRIKKVFHAGEFLSPRQAEFIGERLDCVIHPFLYSSTDTGTIGMKCPHCETNQYHIADSMYLEALDPETLQPAPTGTAGEFIVTSLVNLNAPCIRYRVGDRGVIDGSECRCNFKSPLFTLLGRADDQVKVAGYLISPEIVRQGLDPFPQLSKNIQLVIEESGQKTRLTVICELLADETGGGNKMNGHKQLAQKIAGSLVAHYDILGVLVEKGYCQPPEVRLLPPGAIPRNPRTGKIKPVRIVT
jgi:phenylacetate-coenzyme A ligase PaaK-like adenylate-forming protein